MEEVVVLDEAEDDDEVQVIEVKVAGSAEVIDLCCSYSDDEYARLSDLRAVKNLAAVIEFEKYMGMNKAKKKKKKKTRRKKKKRKWHECLPQEPPGDVENKIKQVYSTEAVETVKTRLDVVLIDYMPQNIDVDSTKEEDWAGHSKTVEIVSTCQSVDGNGSAVSIDLLMPTSEESERIADLNSPKCVGHLVPVETVAMKKVEEENMSKALKKTVNAAEEGEKSCKIKAVEIADVDIVEVEKHSDRNRDVGTVTPLEIKSPEMPGNVVLRKLLRGPRYFDFPKSFCDMCCNRGRGGHAAVNCMAKGRKKPCYICGGFEHKGRHCKQGFDCFFCQKKGHLAKDCPDKNDVTFKICLRCGDSGHDTESCTKNYSSDDLKKIRCYVCNNFGHLCCVDFPAIDQSQVSCYSCGQSGHVGLVCIKSRGANGQARVFKCYLCGEKGHFAVECKNVEKAKQRAAALLTPKPRVAKNKGVMLECQSTPHSSVGPKNCSMVKKSKCLDCTHNIR